MYVRFVDVVRWFYEVGMSLFLHAAALAVLGASSFVFLPGWAAAPRSDSAETDIALIDQGQDDADELSLNCGDPPVYCQAGQRCVVVNGKGQCESDSKPTPKPAPKPTPKGDPLSASIR